MEFIKVRDNNEIVKIKITIEYTGPCKYSFATSGTQSFDYTSSDTPPKPYPHEYEIGKGKDLILVEFGNNNWDFQLINPTNQDLNYELYIEWYQGNDSKPFYIWPMDENIRLGKIKAQSIENDKFIDNCIYE